MKAHSRFFHMAAILFALSCASPSVAWNPFRAAPNESVMTKGMVIEASNIFGRIRIEAGEGTRRMFSWDGGSESVRLMKRGSRWYGSLGLYHPGGNPSVHLVVDEGQQHFCSENEANEWLLFRRDRMNWACSSNGLVVGWYKTKKPDRDYWAVIVEVWQVYIKGQMASNLRACTTRSVQNTEGAPRASGEDHSAFIPSEPRLINGRLYSGRAQDLIAERGITPADVEATIADGKRLQIAPPTPGWAYYNRRTKDGMLIVILDDSARVILLQN